MEESQTRHFPRCRLPYLLFATIVLVWYLVCVPIHPLKTIQYLSAGFSQSRWDPSLFLNIASGHLKAALMAWGWVAVLLATGARVLRLFQGETGEEDPGDWSWALGLGLLIWGIFSTGLAMNGLLSETLSVALMAAVLAAFLLSEGKGFLARPFRPLKMAGEWTLGWRLGAGSFAFLALVGWASPEMSWDAMTYQLSLPKFYLIEHGFYPVERIPPAHAPSLGQMVHVWGLALGDDRVARAVHLAAFLGTMVALYSAGRALFSRRAGGLAALLYGCTPFLVTHAYRGYVDHFTALLATLGLLGLVRLQTEETTDDFGGSTHFLSLIALGALGAFKYTAPMFWAAGVILLLRGWVMRRWGVGKVIAFLSICALFSVPWLLKNFLYTGDPVYPYLSNWFSTRDWTLFDARASSLKFPVEGWRGLLRLPGVLYGVFFSNYGGARYEDVGPVLVLSIPFLFLLSRPAWRVLSIVLLPGAVILGSWLVTSHQLRLVMPLLGMAALAAGAAWDRALTVWDRPKHGLAMLLSLLVGLQVLSLLWGMTQQSNPFPHFAGMESRERYLDAVLRPEGYLKQVRVLGEALPRDARVLSIGLSNPYYLERTGPYDFDHVEPALGVWARGASDADELFRRLRRRGITHIAYNAPGAMGAVLRSRELGLERYAYTERELAVVEDFFLRYMRRLPWSISSGFTVYKVGPRPGYCPMPPYLPGTEGAYLEAMRELAGVSALADLSTRIWTREDGSRVSAGVTGRLPRLGLAWFQAAIAKAGQSGIEAFAMGRRGLAVNGDEASWEFLQGHHLLKRGLSRRAIPHLEAALHLGPERADAASNLAVAYYNVRLFGEALAAMEHAASLEPWNPEYAAIVRQWQAVRSRSK